MRFAETDGWPRPANSSRTVTEIESIVQCTKNATTYTANPSDQLSPAAGMCGSANVNTVRPIVSAGTIRRRSSPGGTNVVANRYTRNGKSTRSSMSSRCARYSTAPCGCDGTSRPTVTRSADRDEREREPPGGARSMGDPEPDRDHGQHDETDRVQDPDGDDERVHIPPGRCGGGIVRLTRS